MKSVKRLGARLRGKRKEEGSNEEIEQVPGTAPEAQLSTPQAEEAVEVKKSADAPEGECKIYIIFYSMYGHVYQLAQSMQKGVASVPGCQAVVYQVAETLPVEVLEKMHAPPKPDIPIITPKELADADAILFGFPTRFGMMCSQMKALFDATGGLWQSGALAGKPAGFFTSTGTEGGGQETTIMTALTQLVHHGMIFIPPGYTFGSALYSIDEPRGGGPWGAGTFAAADGSRQPSEVELSQAEHQGKYFAEKAKLLSVKS